MTVTVTKRKRIILLKGDKIRVSFMKMKKGKHYKFQYIDGEKYSAGFNGVGVIMYSWKTGHPIPIDPEDDIYQQIIYPRAYTIQYYTCIKCGRETRAWSQARRRVCDDCTRKRASEMARKRRSTKTTRVYSVEEIKEVIRTIIPDYIASEVNGSNFIHTKYIYNWAASVDRLPKDISHSTIKRYIPACLCEFGYSLYRVVEYRGDRIYRKVLSDE